MIASDLRQLEELLSISVVVSDVEVVRRSIRATDLEKVLNYRYHMMLANGGLIEMTERVLETQGALEVNKYRHHWAAEPPHTASYERTERRGTPRFLNEGRIL